MGVPDKFYRQGRDIAEKYLKLYQEDPSEAEVYLSNEMKNARNIVKRYALSKIKLEHPEHD